MILENIVRNSVRHDRVYVVGCFAVILAGVYAALHLPIDAIPDVSTIQVSVLTEAAGLSPQEMEQMVTFPIEMAINGTPGMVEQRSISREGLSAVTAIFRDGTDPWFARQLVLERLRDVEHALPRAAGKPQLAPLSTGLGEIYQFVVRSDHHSPMQLRTLLDWEIVPRLRSVAGVIEVNTMGGELKQFQVVIDPARLQAYKVTLQQVRQALEAASGMAGGGYLERGGEALTIRGVGLLKDETALAAVALKTGDNGAPVLVSQIGTVRVGAALRYGTITRDGEGEAVTGIVMMLLGANSRDVVLAVKRRVAEIQRDLPAGVKIEAVYDRSDFVGRTLTTVVKNLLEGALVVGLVLTLLLGTLRGAVMAVLGIPVSMAFALFGMHLFGVTGDLMSLGAIDFGFLVDGPIVMLEAIVGALAGKHLVKAARNHAYADISARLVRPVGFSVAIISLVYLPLLALQGVEGKMFRPMTITMACALFGAVVYAVVFFPALLVRFVPVPKAHEPRWLQWLSGWYGRFLPWGLAKRRRLFAGAAVLLVGAVWLLARGGADFLPRMEEGDLVVTIRRAPSIGMAQARELDLAVSRVLRSFPEVLQSLAMNGRAEVATDPNGFDSTDILVRLVKDKGEWRTARDLDGFSAVIKERIERQVPGTFVSVSQPIEDRTNELISGSRADVQIQIFGNDLTQLRRLSEAVAEEVRDVSGTGDVRVERLLGMPALEVVPNRSRLARYDVQLDDVLLAIEAARLGVMVGTLYEGERRFEVRLVVPPQSATVEALGDLFVEARDGSMLPLSEVAEIAQTEGPAQIRRENMQRAVRVDVNLRGRDLVSWVAEAESRVAQRVPLSSGYRLTWGGQFENFQRASATLALVVPLALLVIFGMLFLMFRDVRYAVAVFANVPLAVVGGALGLYVRALPLSLPAVVGFIALSGVSVLNGVIISAEVRRLLGRGHAVLEAVREAAMSNLRAVLTTAAVAALGFFPMAFSTGAGAEVQRPLATVVICGIALSTVLTLLVFPSILATTAGGFVVRKKVAESTSESQPSES